METSLTCSAPTADAVVQPCAPKPPSSVLARRDAQPAGRFVDGFVEGGSTGGGGGGISQSASLRSPLNKTPATSIEGAASTTQLPRRTLKTSVAQPSNPWKTCVAYRHVAASRFRNARTRCRARASRSRVSLREDTQSSCCRRDATASTDAGATLVEDAHVGARRELEHQLQARLLARRAEARSPILLHMQQGHEALGALLEGVVLVSF